MVLPVRFVGTRMRGRAYFPRRPRRTARFATEARLDVPLPTWRFTDVVAAASFAGAGFVAAREAAGGARRVAHAEQRPSRSARSSRAISSGPSRLTPQYVVVLTPLSRGACQSREVFVVRKRRRTQSATARSLSNSRARAVGFRAF